MSFQRKALTLTWPEGSEFYGLEVLCRRPSIAQVEQAQLLFEKSGGEREAATVAELMRTTIGAALVRWNYVDEEGYEVAATPDGYLSLDLEAQMEILGKWISSAVAVPRDLGKESDSGRSSPVAKSGIPVTGRPGLSSALQNLPMHSEPSRSSEPSPVTP